MSTSEKNQARFNARLPKEQKQLFEKAATLGGFRSLTDFVMWTAQEKATEIISKQEQILASERDAHLFFNIITKPAKPSKTLRRAAEEYKAYNAKTTKK
jgi:uncharacterized protein (DUF1778 family)